MICLVNSAYFIFYCLYLITIFSLTFVDGQTQASLPTAVSWGGFTSDNAGIYLTAAQNVLTSGSYGQIYFSLNGGVTWMLSDSPAVGYRAIASSPNGKYVVTASTVNGPYFSSNYGANWTFTAIVSSFSVAISGSGQYMASIKTSSATSCLSYSSNYGSTWGTIAGPPGYPGICEAVALDSTGLGIVLSIQGYGLFVSSNSGSTWSSSYSFNAPIYSISYDNSGSFYAGLYSSPYSILKSSNGGVSWTTMTSFSHSVDFVSAAPSGKLVAVVNGGLYYSTTSGSSFTEISHGDVYATTATLNSIANLTIWNQAISSSSAVYLGNPNSMISSVDDDNSDDNSTTVIIILSVVFGVVGVGLIILLSVAYWKKWWCFKFNEENVPLAEAKLIPSAPMNNA